MDVKQPTENLGTRRILSQRYYELKTGIPLEIADGDIGHIIRVCASSISSGIITFYNIKTLEDQIFDRMLGKNSGECLLELAVEGGGAQWTWGSPFGVRGPVEVVWSGKEPLGFVLECVDETG